jgi:teichuronic acid biosynthesis glycosyltransferase TuaG
MKNLVSVITPVFNSEKYITQTFQSLLNQTYSNWEWVLVDDCSSDNSVRIIEEFMQRDGRVILLKNLENLGSGVARNKAIENAKGDFIAFLDSDDIWHPKKLEIQVNLMLERNIAFSHTSYGYINEHGNKIKSTFHVSDHPVNYKHLLKRTEISCLTAIYNCKSIGKFYMSDHRRKQDYALWLAILKTGVESHPIDMELAFYRQTPNSATSNKFKLIYKHYLFLRSTQGLNPLATVYYSCFWAINGFVRYYIK